MNIIAFKKIIPNFITLSNLFLGFTSIVLLSLSINSSSNYINTTCYLILLSTVLELLHIIVPNRGFEVADLLGNIFGVLLSLILFKLFIFRKLK